MLISLPNKSDAIEAGSANRCFERERKKTKNGLHFKVSWTLKWVEIAALLGGSENRNFPLNGHLLDPNQDLHFFTGLASHERLSKDTNIQEIIEFERRVELLG